MESYAKSPGIGSLVVMSFVAILISYGVFHSFKPVGNPLAYYVPEQYEQAASTRSLNYPPDYKPEVGVGGGPLTPPTDIPWCQK